MSITDVCIKKPVLAWMLMASTILFGVIAISRVGVSQYPDVDYPNITVSVSWPGASPAAVERQIVDPIEQAISQVEGVQQITSTARQNNARITAVFDISRDVDVALQDIQAKVAQAQRQLPKDVQAPTISKSNPDDQPILTIGVTGPFARQLLADVARYQVQQDLQTISGVGQITLDGYTDRNVRVWLDQSKMAEKNVAASDVIGAIQREHVDTTGGQLQTGNRQINVQLLGEAIDIEAFRAIVVRRGTSNPVRLGDVALVEDGFADVTSIAHLDGVPVQALGVLKQRGSNAVSVAEAVREKVTELSSSLPEGMRLVVLSDTTRFIEESVHEMELELGLALVLTALVCWLFLGSLSSTLNVVLAIPMSLCGTVAITYFLGYTLNTFTLLGLSLAVGLVVDDAVMVMENIYRHAEMGKDKKRAAADGTKEITFAALAATAAVIAIFLPVVFMKGVIGKFFLQFGVTLSIAVVLSYIEAITLAPARCAQILNASRENRGFIGRQVDKGFAALERFYERVLGRALKRAWLVLLFASGVLGASIFLLTRLPTEFVPSQDQGLLQVRLQTSAGASLQASEPILSKAEAWIMAQPEVAQTLSTLNGAGGFITITLVDRGKRKTSAQEFGAKVRAELSKIAGLRASVSDPSQQSFGAQRGSPVELTVRGADWDQLVENSLELKDQLERSGVVTDVTTDYQIGAPELQITPDRRRATDLGVSMADLGTTISALVGGTTLGKFESDGRLLDIRARLLKSQRSRPEDIGDLRVRSKTGELVPMSLVVTQTEKPVLQSITRIDRERAVTIRANVAPGHSQGEAITRAKALGADLPLGYRAVLGGQSTQLEDTTSSLTFALIVGIAVAYMVLASQFNSFLHPVTVLTILPLAIVGAILGLMVVGATLNIFSMIGLLLLMGIVKKNSIMLVEYANQIREHEDVDAATAMQRAGPIRLRPILMTTVATMMSAVPPVLGLGPGSETRGPMGAAVLGGLTVSTVLSLVIVPAFYVVTDKARQRILRRRTPAPPPAPPPAMAPTAPTPAE
ncbi:MAG: efflux RND transporter permease subunit [Polyangiaceae bacterium]